MIFAVSVLGQPALAANHLMVIDEILASWQGDDEVQFIELRMTAAGQQEIVGAELEILDRDGTVVQQLPFPSSVVRGLDGARILIATPKLEGIAGLTADFRIAPGLIPLVPRRGGRICYRATDLVPGQTRRVDCVAYGAFRGNNDNFGTPAPLTPINRSLQRIQNSANNAADFRGILEPTPENNLGQRSVLQTACLNDGHIDPGEECDGANLAGKTCVDAGFAGGKLRCAQCHLDTSGCTNCGNGTVDAGEECDGEDLHGGTCPRLGFTSGTLTCGNKCTFDTAGCEGLQIPGGGPARPDCFLEWHVEHAPTTEWTRRPAPRQRCVDGDPTCDFDGGTANTCSFRVRLCFNRDYQRLRRCRTRGISSFELRRPAGLGPDPVDRINASSLLGAVVAVDGATQEGDRIVFSPVLDTVDVCTGVTDVVVPLRERVGKRPRRARKILKVVTRDGSGRRRDRDKLKLSCLPGR